MEGPFSDKEIRFVLAEVVKTSSVPIDKLITFINESDTQPIWTEVLLPFGRNLSSCINVWDTLRAGPPPSSLLIPAPERKRKSAPEALESLQAAPQPKRRQSGADTMIRIQPQPSSNGSPLSFTRPPFTQPKKRGRPSKADVEARNSAAIARGEVIPPPKIPVRRESMGGDARAESGISSGGYRYPAAIAPVVAPGLASEPPPCAPRTILDVVSSIDTTADIPFESEISKIDKKRRGRPRSPTSALSRQPKRSRGSLLPSEPQMFPSDMFIMKPPDSTPSQTLRISGTEMEMGSNKQPNLPADDIVLAESGEQLDFHTTEQSGMTEPPEIPIPKSETTSVSRNVYRSKNITQQPNLHAPLLSGEAFEESLRVEASQEPHASRAFLRASARSPKKPLNSVEKGPEPSIPNAPRGRLRNFIDRFLRPPIPARFRRLEWQCECGTWLYGDFDNSDPDDVEELYHQLTKNSPPDETQKSKGVFKHSPDSASTANTSATALLPVSQATAQTLPSQNTRSSAGSFSSAPTNISPTLSSSSDSPQNILRKYFAICANTGNNLVSLGEVNVTTITLDSDFFQRIWEEYESLRGFRTRGLRSLLIKAVDVKFVQFTLEDHHRVDVSFDPPHIPPESEVRSGTYLYSPCPLPSHIKQPIPASTFLHYCIQHQTIRSTVWISRLPKRLNQRLLELRMRKQDIEYVPGWGVYIIEGPNWKGISRLGALVLSVVTMVSVIYAGVKKDPSGGFTVGGFLVTVWMAWMTAFYYQWKEE